MGTYCKYKANVVNKCHDIDFDKYENTYRYIFDMCFLFLL